MIPYDAMPQDNADLAKISIEFSQVPFTEVSEPNVIEPYLLDYLTVEGFPPEDKIEFLRTAAVEDTVN
ncbi:MAG: hypothetical protein ABJ308_14990 [Halieaceae bacterium]